jgi:hypothetical protein
MCPCVVGPANVFAAYRCGGLAQHLSLNRQVTHQAACDRINGDPTLRAADPDVHPQGGAA